MSLFSWLFGKGGYKREGALTSLDRQTVRDGWLKIEEQASFGKPSNYRSAVIDADKLVDFVLRKMYPADETMGERLKSAKDKFINYYEIYDGLWFAHKVRNEIVHNVNFELPSVEVRNILDKFKAGLDRLGAI
mgnify:CR=1 FL=1